MCGENSIITTADIVENLERNGWQKIHLARAIGMSKQNLGNLIRRGGNLTNDMRNRIERGLQILHLQENSGDLGKTEIRVRWNMEGRIGDEFPHAESREPRRIAPHPEQSFDAYFRFAFRLDSNALAPLAQKGALIYVDSLPAKIGELVLVESETELRLGLLQNGDALSIKFLDTGKKEPLAPELATYRVVGSGIDSR